MVENSNNKYFTRYRNLGTPKPNVDVICVWCQTETLKVRDSNNPRLLKGGKGYYWRAYECKDCKGITWIGVHRGDNHTVYASISPCHAAFNTVAILYSHEDVVKGWFFHTPKQTKGVRFGRIKTKQEAFEQRKDMFAWWHHVNKLAVDWREDKVELYRRTLASYIDDLPDATSQVTTQNEENEHGHEHAE